MIVSSVLLFLSIIVIIGNLTIAMRWYLSKRGASMIPFIGGIMGAIGLCLMPVSPWNHLWWIPLVIDIGCTPLLVGVLIDQIRKHLASTSHK
jgi:hypothetical protein